MYARIQLVRIRFIVSQTQDSAIGIEFQIVHQGD